MKRSRLKTTTGVFTLIASILFVIFSPFSFVIMMIALANTNYQKYSFLVFIFALYYLIVSIIMLTKFKTRKKSLVTSLNVIFSNIITLILYVLLIIRFIKMEESDTATLVDVLSVFLMFIMGFIYIFIVAFSMVFSLISLILGIIYLILVVKSTSAIELTIEENKEYRKNEPPKI